MSTRDQKAAEVFRRLFGRDATPDQDPELGRILRAVIFGDVFSTGELTDAERELCTVVTLATLQTLPQLRAHVAAALRTGNTPLALREALYSLAPFIGFPRTLNALGVLNEVLQEQGVTLPLPGAATVTDADRHQRGRAIQEPLYGTEIAQTLAPLPEPFDQAVPDLLTDLLFGDLWTRTSLDVATRELVALCALTALGMERQLPPHVRGAILAGSSRQKVLAVLVQIAPYTGLPAALNAIRAVMETGEE